MDYLKEYIKPLAALSENEINYIVSFFYPLTLKNNQHFLQVGQICNKVAFIKTGLVRLYHFNEKGEEITTFFSKPNTFTTSHEHYNNQSQSSEAIQAVVKTELLVINKADLEDVFKKVPSFQIVNRKTVEQVATELKKKNTLLQEFSADKRYTYMMKHDPFIIQHVPLKYLASYIGISPQHLSRIRKQL